ncbi:MAG: hypothetical protein IPP59_07485 [Betaproteobacteria bacterium]|jgi:hypothetical protein|nr:hypothetical protein [Betaproteobacteria bacterium]MBK8320462.1 hypothetical protein [Betaproteobacteria bacterium]MBK9784032.1 hypothetical protein [Candidatus Dechloromonas phosphorivorans]
MHYCNDKDINRLIKEMLRSGWRFEPGRHGKLRHPAGVGFITFPKTPSDHRSLLNMRRDIRRLESKAAIS